MSLDYCAQKPFGFANYVDTSILHVTSYMETFVVSIFVKRKHF